MIYILICYVWLGFLGLFVGSFLNVLIDRLPRGEKITGRSYCPRCKKKLSWYELLPLFSFIFLKGKCFSCKKPISFQYPLIELVTSLLFIFTAYNFQGSSSFLQMQPIIGYVSLIIFLTVSCCLLVIFVSDLKYYIVTDGIIWSALTLAVIYQIISHLNFDEFDIRNFLFELLLPIFSALGAAAFFLLIIAVTKGKGMGLGDAKIAAFMGFLLSYPNIIVALSLSFLTGSIVGLVLIALRKKNFKSTIPFGIFLAPSTYIAFFWGEILIKKYLLF